MLKSILLSLSCLIGVNRAVAYQYVTLNNGTYYYSDLGYSNNYSFHLTDGDSLYHKFTLRTSVDTEGYNNSDDTYSSPVGNDFSTFDNLILYAWSGNQFFVTYDDSASSYAPSVSFDSNNSRYIMANYINYDTMNNNCWQSMFNNDYFLSFEVTSSSQYVYVIYDIHYTDSVSTYDSSINNTYNGIVLIDTTVNNVVNIPYFNPSSFIPAFNSQYVTCDITLIMPSQSGYSQGYSDGYNNGNVDGYQEGYSTGRTEGESAGYDLGFIAGSGSSSNFVNLFFAVTDTPLYFLKSLFSVEILGIKVYTVVLSLITTMVMIWVIRKFVL